MKRFCGNCGTRLRISGKVAVCDVESDAGCGLMYEIPATHIAGLAVGDPDHCVIRRLARLESQLAVVTVKE